ncbi:hypothetical protein FRB99_008519, partial [Tulasnella sp. 403]
RIGRKPVVITGLAGVAVASFCFGLSPSFWQILLSRAIAGGLSGNVAVIRSIIGEITDETNQAQAFPLEGVTWCIGCVIGPLIGGMLSHPAERYPSLFGNFQLLKDKPYLLPCFASSIITVVSILSSIFFLEEVIPSTLPSKVLASKCRDRQAEVSSTASSPTECSPTRSYQSLPQEDDLAKAHSARPNTLALLNKRVVRLLMAGFMVSFMWIANDTIFVLWAYTPASLGGFQRNPSEIGGALASAGFLGILLASFGFSELHKRFHTLPIFVFTMSMYPVVFATIPILGMIARSSLKSPNGSEDPSTLGCLWAGVAFVLTAAKIASMSFTANALMVKHFTESPELAGGMFGLSQSAAAIAEATGPAIASYADIGRESRLGGYVHYCGHGGGSHKEFAGTEDVMTGNGTIDASKDTAVHVASPTFPLETSGDDGIEEQPLLPNKTKPTPLPKLQLAIACFARLAEPIAYTQIFPYINQMVEELHVTDDPAEVGFYSGLV